MFFTAQCDAGGICYAVTQTTGPLVAPSGKIFVPMQTCDESVIGKRWNGAAFVNVA